MLEIIVFAIAFTMAQAAAGFIVLMVACSKWYANKVMEMTFGMMETYEKKVNEVFKEEA